MNVKKLFKNFCQVFVIIGLMAIAWVAYSSKNSTDTEKHKDVKVVENAMPPVTFFDGDGRAVTLQDFKGKVLLVNLWATWCAPCVKELPSLSRLAIKMEGQDFQVILISMDRGGMDQVRDKVHDFLQDLDGLASYFDRDREIVKSWKYQGLPTSFLIDRNGALVEQFNGDKEWDSPEYLNQIVSILKD